MCPGQHTRAGTACLLPVSWHGEPGMEGTALQRGCCALRADAARDNGGPEAPPALEESLFESWQSHVLCSYEGTENIHIVIYSVLFLH